MIVNPGPPAARRSRFSIDAFVLAVVVLFAGQAVAATVSISGRVTDREGEAIDTASVRLVATDLVVTTGREGSFELSADLPVTIEVSHALYVRSQVEVTEKNASGLEIVLERRETVADEIAVSASRSSAGFAPRSVATSALEPGDAPGLPTSLTALVAGVPGVSQNGQGGLFQTYSVRGVSRQRVLTLVEGMRIVSERRAGVSASFVDPLLLGSVEVVRGPSSTYWGSGALGGVVQLFPRRFEALTISTGYSTDGDERYLRLGQGTKGGLNWGFAGRARDAGETPGGSLLHSGFDQASGLVSRRWQSGRRRYDFMLLLSEGRDIGKANTDFPERTTTYPTESHGLARFGLSHARGWRVEAYVHPNELETRVETRGVGENLVENQAFDYGLNFERERHLESGRRLRWGADMFGRESVGAREEARTEAGDLVLAQETLRDASEQELGMYGAIEGSIGKASLVGGGRLALQRQHNRGFETREDSALTAFLGAVIPAGNGREFTLNVGTGLRFPSISERFFNGTTGRGVVTGNPGLAPESSSSLDAGFRWTGEKAFAAGSVFYNRIEDYIERIEAAEGELTFMNLQSGEITGIELEGAWQLSARVSLSFGGHLIEGEDEDGLALADIPPQRLYLSPVFEAGDWSLRGRWERRFAKDDPGSGERAIPAADLVTASAEWRVNADFSVRLGLRNLLDERYLSSADRRAVPSPARSASLALEWNL